jgi:hypothetical protein
MENKAHGSAIVVGRQGRIISQIEQMLKPFFISISFLPDLQPAISEVGNEHVRLILLLEPDEVMPEVAKSLRRVFPSAKILGLSDDFPPEQEVVLRSTGVVFLGSYERFSRNSKPILSKALKSTLSGSTL